MFHMANYITIEESTAVAGVRFFPVTVVGEEPLTTGVPGVNDGEALD